MKKSFHSVLCLGLLCLASGAHFLLAQEAGAGFDIRANLTGQSVVSSKLTNAPRNGSPMIAGFHSIVYPTWKINDNWFATGALQMVTRPYFYSDFSTTGYGAKGSVLQATLNYSHVSRKASVLVRAGELSTAFGAFMLHYDDADNALIDVPSGYGYYYAAVSVLGVAGAQIDATRGRWDGRVQFANSSPANPRSIFAPDQYGNWAGGAGFTIRQGFRVGVSGYRGPYLDRKYSYFFPGEVNPSKLPAHGLGMDANWAHGHTNVQVELQKFVMAYTAIPNFRESAGYGEVRQVLGPRWFLATRYGFTTTSATARTQVVESGVGFRPDRFQLLKVSYEWQLNGAKSYLQNNTLGIQFVTTLQKSFSRE